MPLFIRVMSGIAGLFLLIVAAGGMVAAYTGHPPPSHPWAELTLSLLGSMQFYSAVAWGKSDIRWKIGNLVISLLTISSALMWLKSADVF